MARAEPRQDAGGAGGAPLALRPRELLAALRSHEVEFVVIGGLALAPHGYVRATKDLDIVPDPQPTNLARLAHALRALEARIDLGDLGADELGIAPDEEGLSLATAGTAGVATPTVAAVAAAATGNER